MSKFGSSEGTGISLERWAWTLCLGPARGALVTGLSRVWKPLGIPACPPDCLIPRPQDGELLMSPNDNQKGNQVIISCSGDIYHTAIKIWRVGCRFQPVTRIWSSVHTLNKCTVIGQRQHCKARWVPGLDVNLSRQDVPLMGGRGREITGLRCEPEGSAPPLFHSWHKASNGENAHLVVASSDFSRPLCKKHPS